MVVEANKEQQVKYEESQKKQEEEVKSLKSTADASFNRASGGVGSKGKNNMITEHSMFKHLKPYNGDAAQWKDWRYKAMNWLAKVNPAFETLTTKLDAVREKPEPPQVDEQMKIGHEEATEEE